MDCHDEWKPLNSYIVLGMSKIGEYKFQQLRNAKWMDINFKSFDEIYTYLKFDEILRFKKIKDGIVSAPIKKEEIVKIVNEAILNGEIKIDYGPACKEKTPVELAMEYTETNIYEYPANIIIEIQRAFIAGRKSASKNN